MSLAIEDLSGKSTYPYKAQKLASVKGFIVHHTAGGGTALGVIETLNSRKLGIQFIIDRQGKVYRGLLEGHRGAHLQAANNGSGLSNANAIGVEVISPNDAGVLPVQVNAALALIKQEQALYGFPASMVYGHGEVNVGHKEASEGMTIVKAWRAGVKPDVPLPPDVPVIDATPPAKPKVNPFKVFWDWLVDMFKG